MSARVEQLVDDMVVELAWAQWAALSPYVGNREGLAHSMLDPEALLLLSMIGQRQERRLGDVAAGWLRDGARFVSTQRARTLGAKLAPASGHAFHELAAMATAAGDHRWKSYVTAEATALTRTIREKVPGTVRLDAPSALMLRLRAAFGLGTKADILAMLIGSSVAPSLRTIADDLHYGSRPLRIALDDMITARVVERVASSPVTFRVVPSDWHGLLHAGLPASSARRAVPARWFPWADAVVLISHLRAWAAESASQQWTPFVAASGGRDLVERYVTPSLALALAIRVPGPTDPWNMEDFTTLVAAFEAGIRAMM